MPILVLPLFLAAAALGQTNRSMQLLVPPALGQTAQFEMTHPANAAGNLYAFLWSSPPFAGATPVVVPGFQVQGLARIDPAANFVAYTGLLDASGTAQHSLPVPAHPAFLGFRWDLQGLDLSLASSTLSFTDNDLSLATQPSLQWQAQQLLSTQNADHATVPRIAANATGAAVALWSQSAVFANHYLPGAGWVGAELVSAPAPIGAGQCSVGIDQNGYAIAVWEAQGDIWANRRVPGVGWGVPVPLENSAAFSEAPEVVVAGSGDAIAVWSQRAGSLSNAIASRYVAGVGWSAAAAIESDNQGSVGAPRIAIHANGQAVAVWPWAAPNGFGYTYSVWANRFAPGSGWGTAGPIANPNSNNPNPSPRVVLEANGDATVVWEELGFGLPQRIWSNRCTAGVWGASAAVDTAAAFPARDAQVVVDGLGEATAIWRQSDGLRDNLVASRRSAVGVWGAPVLIETNDTGPVLETHLAIDNSGVVTAVWSHRNVAAFAINIWSNRLLPATGWSGALQISANGESRLPNVASDGFGNLLAVWSQHRLSSRHDIWAAKFQ